MSSVDQIAKLQAELEATRAELAAAKHSKSLLTFKVSKEKACLSVYGLMVRPVTLYAGQWLRLLKHADQIRSFIAEHRDSLAWKGDAPTVEDITEATAE